MLLSTMTMGDNDDDDRMDNNDGPDDALALSRP